MNENKIRRLMKENKPVVSTRIESTWPFVTENVGACGYFDYVEFAAEYSPFDQRDMEGICMAAELNNMGTMIKVDFQNRAYVAQKAVGAGFQSIMFTDHRTPDEVRETVKLMKPETIPDSGLFGYPYRRFIGNKGNIPQKDHIERLRDVVLAFMIEKSEAVESIEEICSIPGVDIVQFGGSDYSMTLNRNRAENGPDCKAAERKMIEAALRHGVQPRCEINYPQEAQYYIDLGVRHFAIGDEMRIKINYWNNAGGAMRDIAGKL